MEHERSVPATATMREDSPMGAEVDATEFTRDDRKRHRDKVRKGLDVLARMLTESRFDFERPMAGLEIELNLVDMDCQPAMRNAEVLAAIADPSFQTELGRFNIEINVDPRRLADFGFADFEQSVRKSLNDADPRAKEIGAQLVMIGILPTLMPHHVTLDSVSENPRYSMLDQQIFAARGEDLEIIIDGVERLAMVSNTIMPEAACTSTQVHLQVSPDDFAGYWNAAQAIAGVQVALGANSPFLFGKQLVSESRIPLFEQSTDTRSDELKAQGVRPRVWFGERWITSIFDLFEENSRYFPALLPISSDEDPVAVLDQGGVPHLDELRLHNGTVYRWNRPVYDISDGTPHLRVENRVLPAGPTVVDTMANAAFFAGLVRALADEERPIWTQMSFQAAQENFVSGIRHGINAEVYWPQVGQVHVAELVVRKLLPMAAEGLRQWEADEVEIGRLLDIIERRCLRTANGSTWQVAEVARHEQAGASRQEALQGMLSSYLPHMHSNEPVHTWEVS
jgi:gamma-glutamyl:cysteine ligase YbdK (ATP-grasp superfamily)